MKNFEKFLGDYFMDLREIGGVAITKDNCEDLFDSWLENLQVDELIDLADKYAEAKSQEKKAFLFEDFIYEQFEQEMEHNDRIFGSKIEKNMSFDVWKSQLTTSDWIELGEEAIKKALSK